jgi:uncharacterized protein YbjT (DUF2867 family)
MTILVTGATGNIGRRVVDQLLAAGATDVRALTVDPARAALPPQVEVAVGYIGRAGTLPAALAGVERMYLAPPPGPTEVLTLAKEAGVRRVVDVSGPPDTWWNHVREDVENSGLEWTHLWPGEFMDNFTMWAPQIRRGNVVRDAYPTAANAAVSMDDIAAIAATALLDDGHIGQSYLLTGPETLTRADRVRIIGEVLGRDLRYQDVGREEAVAELAGVLGPDAEWYVDLLPPSVEHPQPVDGTFARVMGRPPISFAQWVSAHAADFTG